MTAPSMIQDSVLYADGTAASGKIWLTWPPFQWANVTIVGGQQAFPVAPDGTISIPCFPTIGAQPGGVYYTVVYELDKGPVYREYWAVPPTPTVVSIGAVRTIPEMPQNQ